LFCAAAPVQFQSVSRGELCFCVLPSAKCLSTKHNWINLFKSIIHQRNVKKKKPPGKKKTKNSFLKKEEKKRNKTIFE
jgi:hypothetical protein